MSAGVPAAWSRQMTVWAALATSAVCLPALALPVWPLAVQSAVLVVAVATLGLPHGAVDHLQARALLRPRSGRFWVAVFAGLYLGAAALVVAAWVHAPPLVLSAFLALAAVHFGAEDVTSAAISPRQRPGLRVGEGLIRGALPIAGPVAGHPGDTGRLFAVLLPEQSADQVVALTAAAASPATACLVAALGLAALAAIRRQWAVAAELLILTVVLWYLAPLIGFVVYFCFWHAPRHTLRVVAARSEGPLRQGLRWFIAEAWPITALTIALGAGAAWFVDAQTATHAALRLVFVGLAALTVPHVGLGAWSAAAQTMRRRP